MESAANVKEHLTSSLNDIAKNVQKIHLRKDACQMCGAKIDDDTVFCQECGSKIERCHNCNSLLLKDSEFCINCGTKRKGEE